MSTLLQRLFFAAVGLALAAASANLRVHAPDPNAAAAEQPNRDTARAAIVEDPNSAYRWADYAEVIAPSDPRGASQAFARAVKLAPGIPQIWVRFANFCFMQGDYPAANRAAARVLAEVPDYDAILFHYFDAMELPPAAVVAELDSNPRAVRSWLDYSIQAGHPAAAVAAWKKALSDNRVPAPLAFRYIAFLLQLRQWYDSVFAWAEWLGKGAGDYPQRNLVYNGDFHAPPNGGPLDWTVAGESDFFEITLADSAAHIHFGGKTNLDFNGLTHPVVFPLPGRYRLTARYKAQGLTTNEGPRMGVPGLQKETESLRDAGDWTPITLELFVNKPGVYPLAIIRRPSQKFDNKIEGDFYISRVSVTPIQ